MGVFLVISRYGTRIIALAALSGLFLPELSTMLRPWLGHFVLAMLTVSLLRVDLQAFLGRLRRPVPAALGAAWTTILLPSALLFLVAALAAPWAGPVALVIVFLFCAPPPIVSAPAFAMLMGLDGALVLATMLIATALMPLSAPIVAAAFVGDALPIGAGDLALRLATLIATGFVAAMILRRLLGAARIAAAKPVFDTISVGIAIAFAIGAMDGVLGEIAARPAFVAAALVGSFAFAAFQMALTYALFRPFVGVDAIAIAYATASRNAGLVVTALGIATIDDTVWLFFALSQLPIFFLPLILQPVGRRLSALLTDDPALAHGKDP